MKVRVVRSKRKISEKLKIINCVASRVDKLKNNLNHLF